MLYYKQEAYAIIGAALKVYNTLGHGFLEAVYQEALEIELNKSGIPFDPQKELTIYYDGKPLKKTYIPDVICYDKIIVEIKAVHALDDGNRAQVHNYLKATGYKLGLLINFGDPDELVWERIVC